MFSFHTWHAIDKKKSIRTLQIKLYTDLFGSHSPKSNVSNSQKVVPISKSSVLKAKYKSDEMRIIQNLEFRPSGMMRFMNPILYESEWTLCTIVLHTCTNFCLHLLFNIIHTFKRIPLEPKSIIIFRHPIQMQH